MILILSVEESTQFFQRRLKEINEDMPPNVVIFNIIERAAIDAQAVLDNLQPKEANEILANKYEPFVGIVIGDDPYEDYQMHLTEEIVINYVQAIGKTNFPGMGSFKVTNAQMITIETRELPLGP